MRPDPATLLHHLERARVAPRGERPLELELWTSMTDTEPAPVLLLTDGALYCLRGAAGGWERLPLDRLGAVRVSVDPTGILTRYEVDDDSGLPWLNLAVAFGRSSFRTRLQALVERPAPPASTRLALLRSRRQAHLDVLTGALAA